jgi:phosphonate transport system substrate-binding protein
MDSIMWRKIIINMFLSLILMLFSSVSWADHQGVKMVVTAAFVSDKGLNIYKDIADYMGRKLKQDISLVTGTTYEESDLLLEHGIVQVGFICGLPYVRKAKMGKYHLIAMPIMAIDNSRFADAPSYLDTPGKYFSYTIVHRESKIQSWADLRGKSYAYNDKQSNSGYNMPRHKLVTLGAKSWEDYFSHIFVSGSHEKSIKMVAHGHVDASSVDSLVLDYDRTHGDPDALNVRIIEVLFKGGAGIPPVVVNETVDVGLRQKLQTILTTMHETKEGRDLLSRALIDRFAPPDDSNYDDIRKMEAAAFAAGFIDHVE